MFADRISVVIPTFNSAGTIRQCLCSLACQKVPPHEVIVVDGNSDDKTEEIVRDFPDVALVKNKKSHYCGSSRNLGIERATGNRILLLDSDCRANKKLILFHATAYKRVKRLHGVQGSVRSFRKTKFARVIQSHFLSNYWINNVKRDGISKLNSPAGTNLSLDKNLLLRNKFSEDLSSCEDIELFVKLRRTKKIAILLEPRAVVYHPHPNSIDEIFAQRKGYGKGSVNFYRKYWHSSFKRNSILNTCRRYIKWDTQRLASALFTDHRKLCAGCQFGKCHMNEYILRQRSMPDTKYIRQITCLAWAAGVLKVRTNLDYDWRNARTT
jgi:glycosyltransferase involved in cell wall biosynthesis